jgi:Zn-dependent M28 family amino/carboxypeptidase
MMNAPGTGIEPYLHSFEVDDEPVNNVVGLVWGDRPGAEAIVLGAHYDGVGTRGSSHMPLSDDNASGTAILIASAEALARAVGESGHLPYTVVFVAFGSEEDGLLGARHYCMNPVIPLEKTRAMINLDTIGRPRSAKLEIVGWSRYRELSSLLEHFAAKEELTTVAGPRSLWWRSDHAVFAEAGVPAVWLLGHLRDDIHSPSDTSDRLDYEWMARVARALEAAIRSGLTYAETR